MEFLSGSIRMCAACRKSDLLLLLFLLSCPRRRPFLIGGQKYTHSHVVSRGLVSRPAEELLYNMQILILTQAILPPLIAHTCIFFIQIKVSNSPSTLTCVRGQSSIHLSDPAIFVHKQPQHKPVRRSMVVTLSLSSSFYIKFCPQDRAAAVRSPSTALSISRSLISCPVSIVLVVDLVVVVLLLSSFCSFAVVDVVSAGIVNFF